MMRPHNSLRLGGTEIPRFAIEWRGDVEETAEEKENSPDAAERAAEEEYEVHAG